MLTKFHRTHIHKSAGFPHGRFIVRGEVAKCISDPEGDRAGDNRRKAKHKVHEANGQEVSVVKVDGVEIASLGKDEIGPVEVRVDKMKLSFQGDFEIRLCQIGHELGLTKKEDELAI